MTEASQAWDKYKQTQTQRKTVASNAELETLQEAANICKHYNKPHLARMIRAAFSGIML